MLEILKRSDRLGDVFVDAQRFLDQTAEAIAAELHRLLVGGIRYERLQPESDDSEWEMSRFENEELISYLNSLATSPGKAPYEYVEYDSVSSWRNSDANGLPCPSVLVRQFRQLPSLDARPQLAPFACARVIRDVSDAACGG